MSEEYLNPPRGMRDIVGKDAEIYEYIMLKFRKIARLHGFEPIITPTIEYLRLFEVKSGEEIRKSMYVFEDKAGRLVALRPEVTASVVRAYLRHMRGESKPIRLYYISQCFRYEEPQYARYREFWQGGLEIIGDPDVNADVLVAYTASSFLDDIGIKHHYVVGNVAIYRAFMKNIGISEETQDHVLHLIDKDMIDKAIEVLLSTTSSEYVDLFKEITELKLDKLEGFINDMKNIFRDDYEKVVNEYNRLVGFIYTLKELGYDVRYDPKLVRGLAYYTGLIFEYKVPSNLDVSIGGGGRYDGLSVVYKGVFEYFTGLALGLDRVVLVLEKDLRELVDTRSKVLVALVGDIPLSKGYDILGRLRSLDNTSFSVYRHRSLSRILEYAGKKGFDKVLIIGEREYKNNKVLLKDMKTGYQLHVDLNEISEYLKRNQLSVQ
ncbi:MAG: histidine--tRNA ligase [Desulfurococcaceae archaeon]